MNIRWIYQRDIDRYEYLERKGKLSKGRRKALLFWRDMKAKYPNLVSIEEWGKGDFRLGDTGRV